MVLSRLLRNPDPTPSGGGGVTPPPAAPVSTVPTAESLVRTSTPSAADALGLDEPVSKSLGAVFDQNRRNLAPSTAGPAAPEPPKPPTPPEPPKPAAPEPPTPPTPPVAPEPPKPEPRKLKIGDKEYTEEELAKIVTGQNQPQPPPQPEPPKPAQPEPPKPPTAEEVAQQENAWVTERAKNFSIDVTEEALEKVLAGGQEGVETFKNVIAQVAARAHLEARKSIFADLDQDLKGLGHLSQAVQGLLAERQQLQRYTTEQLFVQQYPEFKENIDIARQIGESLMKQYPEQVSKMAQEDFIKIVADQTDKYLISLTKRVQPNFQAKTWKEYWQSRSATPPATPPAAPAPAPATPPATPPAPPTPPVRPPTSHAPTAPVAWNGFNPAQHKSIAASLREP
jgi:hypothetical protein